MQVEIDPRIRDDLAAYRLVEHASGVLDDVVKGSRFENKVSAPWTRSPLPGDSALTVRIDDGQAEAHYTYPVSMLSDDSALKSRMLWLWGDYLGARSRVQLDLNALNEDPGQPSGRWGCD